jgi:hypothetical protein
VQEQPALASLDRESLQGLELKQPLASASEQVRAWKGLVLMTSHIGMFEGQPQWSRSRSRRQVVRAQLARDYYHRVDYLVGCHLGGAEIVIPPGPGLINSIGDASPASAAT